jgi:pSer/pThr/pTyr-binding forkhead associated (FHA) protein
MSSYEEPDWAQEPSSDCQWYLLEAKGGVELAKHALHRACTVLGRAVDMVDIPLQHESASRQHARIAFDSSGTPWLRDLKSTHGTFCNKRKLPPQAVGKVETNSCQTGARGIMLFPGNILQFGASTRIYCVEGPEAFERGAQELKLKQLNSVAVPPPTTLETETSKPEDSIVSWGISMDDDEIPKDSIATSDDRTVPMDAPVPEKHRKMLERLNAHKYKISNLQTEDERIQRKGELSEGQERQLQRNAERETALVESIAELEEELYKKLHPDEAPARHRKMASAAAAYDDDDMDFYDRTKDQSNSVIDTEGESEKTLTVKWKNIYKQQTQRVKQLEQAQAKEMALQERLGQLEAVGDEESFFVQNDLQIAKEAVEKIETEQLEDKSTTMEIERLLKIVNPKLRVMDHESGYIGEGPPKQLKDPIREPPATANNDMMLPPTHIRQEPSSPSNDAASLSMPPPPRAVPSSPPRAVHSPPPPPRTVHSPPPPASFHSPPPPASLSPRQARVVLPSSADGEPQHQPPLESDRVMPPPKRIRVVGPGMPPPAVKGPARPPPQGTLAMLSAHTTAAAPNSHDSSSAFEKEKSANNVQKKKNKAPVVADPKKDEWRAPPGQDGSGITKLNAKFAGRY